MKYWNRSMISKVYYPHVVFNIVNRATLYTPYLVTLIVGDTGSGKTTQIPQYILENASEKNDPCRIFFSQARFRNDVLASASDWLIFKKRHFRWPSS